MANEQKTADDQTHGFNVKIFLVAVIIALVVIMVGIYFFVAASGPKAIPKANQPNPNSRLVLPVSSLAA